MLWAICGSSKIGPRLISRLGASFASTLSGWTSKEKSRPTVGRIILTPPADPAHGGRQADLTLLLSKFAPAGKIIVECPISTSEGVKVPDLVWASKKRFATVGGKKSALTAAPEICVEVLSPSNTRNEIEEKRRLYFAAGASEVWLCERDGHVRFFLKTSPTRAAKKSALFPKMPGVILE